MIVIIPAYQPNEKMLRLIDEIQQNSNYSILVVNDGSAESFRPIFTQAEMKGCMVLTHEINQGKGAALIVMVSIVGKIFSELPKLFHLISKPSYWAAENLLDQAH